MVHQIDCTRHFYACYLLTPISYPQRMKCTYVGFTTCPTRRIRQHNGELVNGARRTHKYQPWEMILVLYGFLSKNEALQFEYAWQQPYRCHMSKVRLRKLQGMRGVGSLRSVKRKLNELRELLQIDKWRDMRLSVGLTTEDSQIRNLLDHPLYPIRYELRPLSSFISSKPNGRSNGDCFICDNAILDQVETAVTCVNSNCCMIYHFVCLRDHFFVTLDETEQQNVDRGNCPCCNIQLSLSSLSQNSLERNREHADSNPSSYGTCSENAIYVFSSSEELNDA